MSDAIHYLRTAGHYGRAPVGTVVKDELFSNGAITKKTPTAWYDFAGPIPAWALAGVKRRVLHYPASVA